MARLSHLVLALLALPLSASCATVLGIEKAELEASGGASGSGGSSSDAGATGGSSGATGGSSGATDAGEVVPAGLCGEYCRTVRKNCTGALEVYPSLAQCLGACKALPQGKSGDTSGNTVECRRHYAESASMPGERDVTCAAASPAGNGVCGDNCEAFCMIALDACTGITAPYKTLAGCMAACKPLHDDGVYTDSATVQKENSQQCRVYHATAATFDPVLHCPHTNIALGKPCTVEVPLPPPVP
jgi:hypothetical protein